MLDAGPPPPNSRRKAWARFRYRLRLVGIGVAGQGTGEACHLVGRHLKTGVHHAEWAEQPLLQKRTQALTGDRLHHQSDDVDGKPVVPDSPGLIQQRCVPELVEETVHVETGACGVGRSGIQRMHCRGATTTVGEAGCVAHHVQHGDRAHRWHGFYWPLAGADALAEHSDAAVPELRQETFDRIGEAKAALLPQHQACDAGNGLGHRCNREQRIARHRR